MRLYTTLIVLLLSFTTAASLGWFMIGLPGAASLLALKDLALLATIGFAVAYRISRPNLAGFVIDRMDLMIASLILVNALSFVMSTAGLELKIINLRRDLSLFLFTWAFYYLGRFRSCCRTLTVSAYFCFIFVVACGFMEYLAPDSLWDNLIKIPEYWRAIEVDPFGATSVALSGRFYSWDLLGTFGRPIRRMVSLYAEPTTLAAFFTFIFCISYLRFNRWFRVLVFCIGVLTLSKFFVISVVLIASIKRIADRLPKHFILICFAVCTAASAAVLSLEIKSGALAHLNGLVDLFTLVQDHKILGFGLGAAGNYAGDSSGSDDIGAESGVGNVAAQLGVGIIVYLWFLNRLFNERLQSWKDRRDPQDMICLMLVSSWTIAFFMSASSLGLSGNAFFFIYIGAVLARKFTQTVSKILFLTPQVPFPPTSGGLYKTYRLLRHLSESHDVCTFTFHKPETEHYITPLRAELGQQTVHSVLLDIKRTASSYLRSLASQKPLTVFRNYCVEAQQAVDALAREVNTIFVDHYVMFQYVPHWFKGPVIVHTHNAEHILWERYANSSANPIKRLLVRAEARRIKAVEQLLLNSASAVLAAPHDRSHFQSLGAGTGNLFHTLHLGDDDNLQLPSVSFEDTQPVVLFVGTLTWEANMDAIRWFSRDIWPLVAARHPSAEFWIAGRLGKRELSIGGASTNRIKYLGFVDDLESLYKQARVFVAPLRFGSGTKVKVVNALYRGIPTVSTDCGIEGLGCEDHNVVYRANNTTSFAEGVCELLSNGCSWERMQTQSRGNVNSFV